MNKKQNIIPRNADGELHGLWIWYYPNGNIGNVQRRVNGIVNGIEESYLKNGEFSYKSYRIKGGYIYGEWYHNTNEIRFNI